MGLGRPDRLSAEVLTSDRTAEDAGADDGRCIRKGAVVELVAPDPNDPRRLLVAELKWRRLGNGERNEIRRHLEAKWSRCSLRARHPKVRLEVFDASLLS